MPEPLEEQHPPPAPLRLLAYSAVCFVGAGLAARKIEDVSGMATIICFCLALVGLVKLFQWERLEGLLRDPEERSDDDGGHPPDR